MTLSRREDGRVLVLGLVLRGAPTDRGDGRDLFLARRAVEEGVETDRSFLLEVQGRVAVAIVARPIPPLDRCENTPTDRDALGLLLSRLPRPVRSAAKRFGYASYFVAEHFTATEA